MRRIWLLSLGLLALAALLPGQDKRMRLEFQVGGRPVTVLYDQFETFKKEENIFRPYGHVEVIWDQFRLKADFLELDFGRKHLFAEGRVSIADRQSLLCGERMTYDFDKHTGELYESFGLITPFVKYESPHILQTDDQTLQFQDLQATSCSQRVPRWKFSCRRGKLKREEYVEMNGAVLRIKNVPVFYFPYLRYPISKEGKQTGFLFPRFGQMKLLDANLQNVDIITVSESFFWNIRSNLDATFNLDYYNKFGYGLGQELRYLFPHAQGNLRFLYMRYLPNNGIETEKRDDFILQGTHEQQIPALRSRLSWNLKWPSRMDFLRYLDTTFERGRSNTIESSAAWVTTLGNLSFNAYASRWETYNPLSRKSDVEWKKPSLNLVLNRQKLGKFPGYFSLTVSYEKTLREGENVMGTPEFLRGIPSERLRLVPAYSLTLLRFPWLTATVDLSSKNSFYPRSYDPEKKEMVEEPITMRYNEVLAVLRGPTFYRFFDRPGKRFKHVIEPKVEFNYATKADNADRLLPVDYADYPSWSYAGFSLSSQLYVRDAAKKDSTRELASLTVSQTYYLDPKAASYGRDIDGVYPSFSELSAQLAYQPSQDLVLSANLAYNYYIKAPSRLSAQISYDRKESFLGGSLSIHTDRNPYMPVEFNQNWSGLTGHLRLGSPRFPIKLTATGDYDFTAKESRYLGGELLLDLQCLLIKATFTMSTFNGHLVPNIVASMSLGNLGMSTPFFEEIR